MSQAIGIARPTIKCLQQLTASRGQSIGICAIRQFQSTPSHHEEAQVQKPAVSSKHNMDPTTVSEPRDERRVIRLTGKMPVGSRRRRAALRTSSNISFEQLPYQCFQEARKVLQEDREEKLQKIQKLRERITRLKEQDLAISGGLQQKENRLFSLRRTLEHLKILADINDPMIKKRFEDGEGDMARPIYRFLADRKWRERDRPILMQRIETMFIVPDILPSIDPTVEVKLTFTHRAIPPGEFVDSLVSEKAPPRLQIQPFVGGEKLVSVVVLDSDVPNVEKDGFDYRCHYMAVNIPISATKTYAPLPKLNPDSQVILPWLPPHAQKGSPYHRLTTFILEQHNNAPIKERTIKTLKHIKRDNFILRRFLDKQKLNPIGAHLFRTQWDEEMADVMKRAGIEGADMEFKRKRGEKLPYKRRDPTRMRG
ncbi:MAG: hypothetical protein M1834_009362 [Cirrosporium novae-zelandiae]|nr:MAG: hypothetical protein M1834_009362 [Cirrosporium novae-zelandiae]